MSRSTEGTWPVHWLRHADLAANRSKCAKRAVGAVIVNANNVLRATGYNGAPRGYDDDSGPGSCVNYCDAAMNRQTAATDDYASCISVHAEVNALLHTDIADRTNGVMFVTCAPCLSCAKAIANSGLSAVYWRKTDKDSVPVIRYLELCGIEGRELWVP